MRNSLLMILLVMASFMIEARAETKPGTAEAPLTPAVFAVTKKAIIDDLKGGIRYMEISSGNKKRVLEALDRVGLLLGNVPSELELTADSAKQLHEDEVVINNLLDRAEADSRLVCKSSSATGSNMIRRRCQTFAKMRARMNNDQDAMRGFSHRLSPSPRASRG